MINAVIDMGVKDLWTILEPVKQHKHLTELRGQVIAVDLSIWIVEAKTLQLKGVTKPHLRCADYFQVSSNSVSITATDD